MTQLLLQQLLPEAAAAAAAVTVAKFGASNCQKHCVAFAGFAACSSFYMSQAASAADSGGCATITRKVQAQVATYEKAKGEIGGLRANLFRREAELEDLRQQIGSRGAAGALTVDPSWLHAEAAFDYISKNSGTTQEQAADMLRKGELPGKFMGQKVKISQRYLSTYKGKIRDNRTIKIGKGRPFTLQEFQLSFVSSMITYGQIRNKAVLHIQVAMLIRMLLLIENGYESVDSLDLRVVTNPIGNRRKRPRAVSASNSQLEAQSEHDPESDKESTDDEADPDPDARELEAREKASAGLRRILGESLSKHLMLPHNYRYPNKRTVARLCKANGWGVRKGQQQTSHRFDGARPDMIDAFFDSVLRTYIQFEINLPCQRHNCDEKHICAEYEQSGRLVKVLVVKRPGLDALNIAGRGRMGGCKSAPDRMIVGITNFPYIDADNNTTLMVYIRKARSSKETDTTAKEQEHEIWLAVHSEYEAAGIAVVVLTTETGYQNIVSFKKSMCYFVRELLKKEGVNVTFRDERSPSMRELGRLSCNHMLFLDNASCHELTSDVFRWESLSHGIVLQPTPPGTTNIIQPLDQHVNKLFTMWMRQFFLRQIEMEIVYGRAGFTNALQMTAWAAQMKDPNAAVRNMPSDLILDLRKDFVGDVEMTKVIQNLNAVGVHSQLAAVRFTSAKVAKLTVGAWIAAFGYNRLSFECCGLAAPTFVNQLETRRGLIAAGRSEMELALIRFELYPHKVKDTPIARAAAEVYENKIANAEVDKQALYVKAGQLAGILPQIVGDMRVQCSAETHELAIESAQLCFGGQAPPDALSLANTLFQARDLILDQQKRDRSLASYKAIMPPPNLAVLDESVRGQQDSLRASNESWLRSKAEKLGSKCRALLKANVTFCSSLTKLLSKMEEILSQRRGWTHETVSKVKDKWRIAWDAFKDNMLLVLNGREQAPKRKSVALRFQDLEELKDAIAAAKDKLKAKCRDMCVEIASMENVLQLHANDWGEVEAAVLEARAIARNFQTAATADNDEQPAAAQVAVAIAVPAAAAAVDPDSAPVNDGVDPVLYAAALAAWDARVAARAAEHARMVQEYAAADPLADV